MIKDLINCLWKYNLLPRIMIITPTSCIPTYSTLVVLCELYSLYKNVCGPTLWYLHFVLMTHLYIIFLLSSLLGIYPIWFFFTIPFSNKEGNPRLGGRVHSVRILRPSKLFFLSNDTLLYCCPLEKKIAILGFKHNVWGFELLLENTTGPWM